MKEGLGDTNILDRYRKPSDRLFEKQNRNANIF